MSRPPAPIPSLLGDAFTTGDALAAGMTPAQVKRLPAPFHGVRCRTAPATVEELARAALVALPTGAAIAGATAAHLHGLWLPGPVLAEHPVEAVLPPGRGPVRLAGITCRREDAHVVDVAGMPVVSRPDVFVQLAPRLRPLDLVALGDSAVRWRGDLQPGDLADAARPRRVGAPRARRALTLVRAGSASAPETHARLWLVDAGLPEPELNGAVVLDDRVVHGDLLWRDPRVCVEYHGGYHFDTAEQRYADFDRVAALRRAGWTVVEIARGTLWDHRRRDAFVDEVAAALGVTPLPRALRGRSLAW